MNEIESKTPTKGPSENLETARNITTIGYALQAASFLIGITFFIAVILDYIKLGEVQGTWLESHIRWQITTFWFGLLWAVIGYLGSMIMIGYAIIFADGLWIIYRVVRGWLRLSEGKPAEA